MKDGWKVKNLGDVGKVSMCKRIYKKETSSTGDIPFYKIGTFGKDPDAYISKELYDEYKQKYSYPKEGEVLLSASGTIGRPVVYDGAPAYFQDSNIVWISHDESEVLNEYLLKFYGYCDWNPSKGATISRLYNDDLRSIKIPIPPVPEQKQIVSVLDKAFNAIDQAKANIEKNIQNAEELFQSKLNEVFSQKGKGWEEKKLNEISDNLDKKRIPITKKHREKGDVPYYGASGIVDYVKDYIFDEDILLISEDGANLLARTYPIAFSVYGKSWVNNHAHVLKFETHVSQKFVEYYINSIKIDSFVSGMAQPKLNQKALNSIPVPWPSISTQNHIVTIVEGLKKELETLKAIYKEKLSSIYELRKSILQKAFTGELTSSEKKEHTESTA